MKKRFSFTVFMACASAAIITACAVPVHAKGFSSPSRGFSAPSRPSVAPRPASPPPRVVNRTTNNTTVIRETRVVQGGGSSGGGGFMSSLLGGAAGAAGGVMLGNALSKPAEAPVAPQQQPLPVQQPVCDVRFYDCTPKVK